MEATVLSVGKVALGRAVDYAESAVAEEVALQLGVHRDQAFVRDELEMMQAFLLAAHDERHLEGGDRIVRVWVKQVRDVAYDAEDTLQDFAARLRRPSWWRPWRIPRTLVYRRRVGKRMKELRAKVEDVSQRNVRYHLIRVPRFKPAAAVVPSGSSADAMIFGTERASRRLAKADVDLAALISEEDDDGGGLKVISVWGTGGDIRQTSVIRAAYECTTVKLNFPCRAWVRVPHPFNPEEFVRSLVRQFNTNILGVDALLEPHKAGPDLAQEFKRHVHEKRYLVVLTDLATIEEWDQIKACFTNNSKKGSRIIVSTPQVEVASLCAGQDNMVVSELSQKFVDQTVYAFHEKGSQDGTHPNKVVSSSDATVVGTQDPKMSTGEIQEDEPVNADRKRMVGKNQLTRIRTVQNVLDESHLIGREKEKNDIVRLVLNEVGQQFHVISVWGMGGIGKTTLVKDVYQRQELSGRFDKRAFVTIMRPLNIEKLLRNLVKQLAEVEHSENMDTPSMMAMAKEPATTGVHELVKKLTRLLQRKKCLIVVDDVSSTAEWDMVMAHLQGMEYTTRIIVTTREYGIAKHCSTKQENVYKLKVLGHGDARDLLAKKVFKENIDLYGQYHKLAEQAELILKRCNGLPLAIVIIGGFLANQPKTHMKWRKFNEDIGAELEMNPELGTIRAVLIKSFDGLPYHLKSCFLYLSIFPEDYFVSRRRLVRRWTAEGYSKGLRGKSADDIADSYFIDLIGRSMILPSKQSIHSRNEIDSCQVHDLMREISISMSTEENLVLRLEDGYSLNSQATVRHLAISSNSVRDKNEFERMVDLSRVRSLTVFGKWKPFFISDKMRLLRVLDLEDTLGLVDHHLMHIGEHVHLKYLSLRNSSNIFHLPDSLGNLRQLETLDIRGATIQILPRTIIKLRELQYLHAGTGFDYSPPQSASEICQHVLEGGLCICAACCVPRVLEIDGFNRRDACTLACCMVFPSVMMGAGVYASTGVMLPRGTKELKALHTLRDVNLGLTDTIIVKEIKWLTGIRKLGVVGINKKNGPGFCSAIPSLSRLESLSVQSEGELGLSGCLDGLTSPPESLQSLKLYGNLVKLPEWIRKLENLVKLKLGGTELLGIDAALQVLGDLPNLIILRLQHKSFQGEELHFLSGAFRSLTVLELGHLREIKAVKFHQGAMPKLEQLQVQGAFSNSDFLFHGLEVLPSINEVRLRVYFQPADLSKLKSYDPKTDAGKEQIKEFWKEVRLQVDKFKEYLRIQLAANPRGPILKVG